MIINYITITDINKENYRELKIVVISILDLWKPTDLPSYVIATDLILPIYFHKQFPLPETSIMPSYSFL